MKTLYVGFCCAIMMTVSHGVQAKTNIVVHDWTRDHGIAWNHHPLAVRYDVEWASSVNGPWSGDWNSLSTIPATTSTYRARVPLFYRVNAEVPDIGVDYHAYGANFLQTAFLTQYHIPSVRQTVLAQMQGMADRGATRFSTRIWLVTEPGTTNFGEMWRATFPLSDQETTNLNAYARDVADIQSVYGHRLRLDIGLLWLGAADYTIGSPSGGLGYSTLPATTFAARVRTTTDRVLSAVSGVNRPDGIPVVETIYFNGEVMVGAKANELWLLTNHYPRFVNEVDAAGFSPSVYFLLADTEAHVLQTNYVDASYPILNNRRSMYWIYRSLRAMADHGLPMPPRVDFSYYVSSSGASYTQLLTRVLDDAEATLPSLGVPPSFAFAETFYFADSVTRRAFGQAIAAEMADRRRLRAVTFWTTPDGGGTGAHAAYPFTLEDYRLPVSP